MNNSVDYQIELNLKNFDDELKAAEQQYLLQIQSIVSKYINKSKTLRQQALKLYEEKLNNINNENNKNKQSNETQPHPKFIKLQHNLHKSQQTTQMQNKSMSIQQSSDSISLSNYITISDDNPSGDTPRHVQKIRESLKRGEKLYKKNQDKTKKNKKYPKHVQLEQDNDNNEDDDLDIIPLNSWSKKIHLLSNSNNSIININKLNSIQQSYDSMFGTTSPVQIHKESVIDTNISDISSITSSRDTSSKETSRLRRKRKYKAIENDVLSTNHYEPPKKKYNIKSYNVSTSNKDLKNNLKYNETRNNLLLRKSVPNFQTGRRCNINATKSFDSKRIQNVMKNIFHSETDGESDDDLLTRKK